MNDKIKFTEIAKRLGIHQSTARRAVERFATQLGITPIKGKQNILYLSRKDTDIFITHYEAISDRKVEETEVSLKRFGHFYIVQLVPEIIPNRVKLGYTDNLEHRLSENKTAAPTLKLLKSWPCKRSWDYAAVDCITREGCELVLNEVYEGEIQGFIDRAEVFFNIMPKETSEFVLSKHSPLKDELDT